MLTDLDLSLIRQQASQSGCLVCLRLLDEIERRQAIVDDATATLRSVNAVLDLLDRPEPPRAA